MAGVSGYERFSRSHISLKQAMTMLRMGSDELCLGSGVHDPPDSAGGCADSQPDWHRVGRILPAGKGRIEY